MVDAEEEEAWLLEDEDAWLLDPETRLPDWTTWPALAVS